MDWIGTNTFARADARGAVRDGLLHDEQPVGAIVDGRNPPPFIDQDPSPYEVLYATLVAEEQ